MKSQTIDFDNYTEDCFALDSLTNSDSIKNISNINILKKRINEFNCNNSAKTISNILYQKYIEIKVQFDNRFDNSKIKKSLDFVLHHLSNKIKNDTLNLKIQLLLFEISTELKLSTIQYNSFSNSIKYGNDDLDVYFKFLRTYSKISKDSVESIFSLLNQNYALNKPNNPNFNLDLYFKTITFYDQVPRILSRRSDKINYYTVNETDLYTQELFKFIVNNYSIFKTKYQSVYDKEIQLVLIHASVTNLTFVETYFKKYFETFNYDFNIIDTPKFIIDNYLKFKYNKQFFGMVKGADSKGKIIELPKLSNNEFQKIMLINFKIENPVY